MAYDSPRSSSAGKLVFVVLILLVVGTAWLGYQFFGRGGGGGNAAGGGTSAADTAGDPPGGGSAVTPAPPTNANAGANPATGGGGPSQGTVPAPADARRGQPAVEINIAYGTEKKLWLEWALEEFNKTPDGQRIKVNLHGRGSVEGARDVIQGPGATPFHVWSPASSAYRDVFETEWQIRHGGGSPIIRAEELALTPMVFVMWKDRYEAFRQKYEAPNFTNLADAMREPGAWDAIAGRPDWGLFKFSHTNPNESNSGLLALVLIAYDYNKISSNLTLANVTNTAFQSWLQSYTNSLARPSGELQHSTGTLMRDMVSRGPSYYDCVMVYENLAIDYCRAAQGRWGEFIVIYPERNMWNENPYYVLDVPWSSAEQRRAATTFLEFLLSEPIQRQAVFNGFRPGNPLVPIKFPDSPFVQYAQYGIQIDIPLVCEPPRAEVINNLLQAFQRFDR